MSAPHDNVTPLYLAVDNTHSSDTHLAGKSCFDCLHWGKSHTAPDGRCVLMAAGHQGETDVIRHGRMQNACPYNDRRLWTPKPGLLKVLWLKVFG